MVLPGEVTTARIRSRGMALRGLRKLEAFRLPSTGPFLLYLLLESQLLRRDLVCIFTLTRITPTAIGYIDRRVLDHSRCSLYSLGLDRRLFVKDQLQLKDIDH